MNYDYVLMLDPPTYSFMDARLREDATPLDLISYLIGRDSSELEEGNFLEFLDFDRAKQRPGMVETLAMENYAALYVGNHVAQLAPEITVVHVDNKRRSIREVITSTGWNPKAVFVTAMSSNFPTAVVTALVLNRAHIPVILGGIHVSTSLQDVDTFIRGFCPYPDLVATVIGPGDRAVLEEVIQDLAANRLRRVYQGHQTIEDGVWRTPNNVVLLPEMRMALLKDIPLLGHFISKKMRVIPVAPFVGCPYSCSFCSISTLPKTQRRLATRSTQDLIEEMESYQHNGALLASRYFFFLADNLLLDREMVEDLADRIIARRLKVNFAAQISVDVSEDEALLCKLRRAGASHFFIGLESLDMRNLEHVGKRIVARIQESGLSVADYYRRAIRKIQDAGISIHGAFIFGLPFDHFTSLTDNTGIDIARFCIENHIGIQPSSYTDLPGSRAFQQSQRDCNAMYGQQGSLRYLQSLCLADLSETNRPPPEALLRSPLVVAVMAFECVQKCASAKRALQNAAYAAWKSFWNPTARGRMVLSERFLDTIIAFASQLIVGVYRKHGELLAMSARATRGTMERLYDDEKDPRVKEKFQGYVAAFAHDRPSLLDPVRPHNVTGRGLND